LVLLLLSASLIITGCELQKKYTKNNKIKKFQSLIIIKNNFKLFLINIKNKGQKNLFLFFMKNFTIYLSTAPIVALAWFTFTAGLLIEINRFFPDPLVFSF